MRYSSWLVAPTCGNFLPVRPALPIRGPSPEREVALLRRSPGPAKRIARYYQAIIAADHDFVRALNRLQALGELTRAPAGGHNDRNFHSPSPEAFRFRSLQPKRHTTRMPRVPLEQEMQR